MNLPKSFIDELKTVLGSDTDKFLALCDNAPYRGISVNRLKTTPEKLLPLLPFTAEKSPFYSDGYYIPSDADSVGALALHHAGGFYVQEPSASCAAELLDIRPGDKVLDLCAAPGGKSSQIASILGDTGLVWSNEVVRNRANILLSNSERMGISHGVVSSCMPDVLCSRLEGFFDRVLVDAPCSGEGMFRKNPEAVSEWSREHVCACAERQLLILRSAVKALKAGGILVYSTCTFSPEENEHTVKKLLEECPQLSPLEITGHPGRKTELSNAVRITPLEGGEGHFAARFIKTEGENGKIKPFSPKGKQNKELAALASELIGDVFVSEPDLSPVWISDRLYLMPDGLPVMDGLGVLRAGVLAGEKRGRRIEPAHSLFTCSKPENLRRVLELMPQDRRTDEFLSGMETDCGGDNGYTAVSVAGMICGFGKCTAGRLKNKYPKGLRR